MRFLVSSLLAFGLLASTASAQDAKKRLNDSPRHGEWVKIKQGDRQIQSYIVYPEVKDKATAVVVIHEIFGLSDWVRSLTDQLAEAGYIAIAPDLLSGMAPGGGGTDELGKGVGKAIRDLPAEQITKDLNAVAAYVGKLDAANGKVAVCGFCWGGGQCFRYATNNPDLKAAFVFYGRDDTATRERIEKIKCPVYGFYGENDERINASIPKTEDLMKAAGKKYEPVIYEGAGHGFMRAGEAPNASEANKKGREEAWKRWKEILAKL